MMLGLMTSALIPYFRLGYGRLVGAAVIDLMLVVTVKLSPELGG